MIRLGAALRNGEIKILERKLPVQEKAKRSLGHRVHQGKTRSIRKRRQILLHIVPPIHASRCNTLVHSELTGELAKVLEMFLL